MTDIKMNWKQAITILNMMQPVNILIMRNNSDTDPKLLIRRWDDLFYDKDRFLYRNGFKFQ